MTATSPMLEFDSSDLSYRTEMERWVIIYSEITADGKFSR